MTILSEMQTISDSDERLAAALETLSASRPSYWSYSDMNRTRSAYDLFQYPAMMVPAMLSDLLSAFQRVRPDIENVCDPFLGSGSVLTASMLQGLGFAGTDVNPLAILIAKVKSGPHQPRVLEKSAREPGAAIRIDRKRAVGLEFPGMHKWFTPRALEDISRIRRAIQAEPRLWCRRFYWVCLAETVRVCSNSRTSTYKLHIREEKDLDARRDLSPIVVFQQVLAENLGKYSAITSALKERSLLERGRFLRDVEVARSTECGLVNGY